MSSLTKEQFRERLKITSSIISDFDNTTIETFIDVALEAYSRKLPEVQWDIDNDIVDGQDLYDYPTSALSISKLRVSDTLEPVRFVTEDQGSGDKIRPGIVFTRSYYELMTKDYYLDPTSYETPAFVPSYSSFDIEYVMLQTMSTIKDTALEALSFYVKYLAYEDKIAEVLDVSQGNEGIKSLSETDTSGASTEVTFVSTAKIADNYRDLMDKALGNFNDLTTIPYGTRG